MVKAYGKFSAAALKTNGAGFEFISPSSKPIIMNKELILKSDLIDILFQNRNKAYGAYELRKFYTHRLKISLLIMFLSAGLLSAFTFLPSQKSSLGVVLVKEVVLSKVKIEDLPKPPVPKLPSEPKQRLSAIFTTSIAIVLEKDSTKQLIDISKYEIGSKTLIDPADGITDGLPGDATGAGKSEDVVKIVTPEVVKAGPIDNPDVQASFPGGQKELIRFLERNLRSPKDIDDGQTIQVQIKFVVDFDGGLQSFDVVKDGGEDFNKEVVRVLKKMPKWNPGKKGGQNIPVYYTIPVKFTSNE